jgi:hypothetical protein
VENKLITVGMTVSAKGISEADQGLLHVIDIKVRTTVYLQGDRSADVKEVADWNRPRQMYLNRWQYSIFVLKNKIKSISKYLMHNINYHIRNNSLWAVSLQCSWLDEIFERFYIGFPIARLLDFCYMYVHCGVHFRRIQLTLKFCASRLICKMHQNCEYGAIFTKPSQLCGHANLLFGRQWTMGCMGPNNRFAWSQSGEGFVWWPMET